MKHKPAKKKKHQKTLYQLRYRIGEYCLRGFVSSLPWIPRAIPQSFTRLGAHVSFLILSKYRQRMQETVKDVMSGQFPTQEARDRLVWQAWNNFAQGIYDTACSMFVTKEELCVQIAIEGEEHLAAALARNKGVIALSAHLGSFTLIGPRLAAAGYPFSVVVKLPRAERFAELQNSYRARVGVQTISARPRRDSVRHILKALRANGIVLLIADEFKEGGVEVDFLGRRVPAPRGPVTIAQRTGAAVVPMFMVRDGNERSTLVIHPELELVRTEDSQQDLAINAARFVAELENMVRDYPEQWNWLGFKKHYAKK